MISRSLFAGAALSILFAATAPALAETPAESAASYHQSAQLYSFPLGKLQIVALSDGTVPLDAHKLLTHIEAAQIDPLLDRDFAQNPAETSINAFLIKDGARHILVDTGAGQFFGPGYGGNLLKSLEATGEKPADITDILITHIHSDHVGGLVKDGQIAFPNATVHVSRIDRDFFLTPSEADKKSYGAPYFELAAKAIGPYQSAGKLALFEDGALILPGIAAALHPGHTPGSAFYKVTSEGQAILFVGDIIHVPAIQFRQPEVTILYDFDPAKAAMTRQTAFKDIVNERTLIAAPHLPFPGVGHISAEGKTAYAWHPVLFRNRDGQ